MNPIRIAVAGLGKRGLWWIDLLQRIPGYRISAIYDRIPALNEAALAKIPYRGEVRVMRSWDDCLDDQGTDAIALCVRCREQGQMAAQALLAGKHVHQEVPAAHTLDDCWQLVDAAERSGKVYQLAEQMRCAGYARIVRQYILEGQFGHITYAEGQYFGHYPDGHYFQNPETGKMLSLQEAATQKNAQRTWLHDMPPIHYLVHDLSPLLFMLDDQPTEVIGMGSATVSNSYPQIQQPDFQTAMVRTARGAMLRLATSFLLPLPADEPHHWWRLIGTRGRATWPLRSTDKPLVYFAGEQPGNWQEVDWKIERDDRPVDARGTGHWDLDFYPQTAFRDSLNGKAQPIVDVYEAAAIAATGILAAESIEQGGRPIAVPDFHRSRNSRTSTTVSSSTAAR